MGQRLSAQTIDFGGSEINVDVMVDYSRFGRELEVVAQSVTITDEKDDLCGCDIIDLLDDDQVGMLEDKARSEILIEEFEAAEFYGDMAKDSEMERQLARTINRRY